MSKRIIIVSEAFLKSCEVVGFNLSKAMVKDVPYKTDKAGKKTGVDYKKLVPGNTIWVTIKKESSPLRGRAIPITKLPSGKWGVDFGAVSDKYKFSDAMIQATSHLEFDPGAKKRGDDTKKKEEEKPKKEVSPEEQAKVKGKMDAMREKSKEGRAKIKEEKLKEAQAISDAAKDLGGKGDIPKEELASYKKRIDGLAAEQGYTGDAKKAYVTEQMEELIKQNEAILAYNISEVAAADREKRKPNLQQLVITIDAKKKGGSNKYQAIVDSQMQIHRTIADISKSPGTGKMEIKGKRTEIILTGNMSLKQVEKAMANPETMGGVRKSLERLNTARMAENQFRKSMHSFKDMTESELRAMSLEVDVSPEALKKQQEEINKLPFENKDGFYSHLLRHWSPGAENKLYPHNVHGGVSAISSLFHEMTGKTYSFQELVDSAGIEGAAAMAASMLYDDLGPQKFKEATDKLTKILAGEHSTKDEKGKDVPWPGTMEAERIAIDKYEKMLAQEAEMEKQILGGEITTPEIIDSMRMKLHQRMQEHLGVAYGSMLGGASMLEMMRSVGRNRGNVDLKINSDSDMSAIARLNAMKVKGSKKDFLHTNPDGTAAIVINTKDLRNWVKSIEPDMEKLARVREIQRDNSAVTDADTPPGMAFSPRKDSPEQRNLTAFARENGGLIAASTGVGKTYVSFGAHQYALADDPKAKGIFIATSGKAVDVTKEFKTFVPGGKVVNANAYLDKWAAKTGPDAHGDPKKPGHWNAERRYQELSRIMPQLAKEGTMLIIESTAAVNVIDAIAANKFATGTVDETHQIAIDKRGKPTEKGRIVLGRLQDSIEKRLATTATPAKQSVDEIYTTLAFARGKEFTDRVDKATFKSLFHSLGRGTNAQDQAIIRTLKDFTGPFMITDREKTRSSHGHRWNITRTQNTVQRSQGLKDKMVALEKEAPARIKEHTDTRNTPAFREKHGVVAPARTDAGRAGWVAAKAQWKKDTGARKYTSSDRGAVMGVYKKNGGETRVPWRDKAREEAIGQLEKRHRAAYNTENSAKSDAATADIVKQKGMGKKHIIFVDNNRQRMAMEAQFKKEGMSTSNFFRSKDKGTIADDWQRGKGDHGNSEVLFMTPEDAASINIPGATDIHFAGNPEDAAKFLQAIGRGDRPERDAAYAALKKQFNIHEYRYSDHPMEQELWSTVEQQYGMSGMFLPGGKLGVEIDRIEEI